jgi:hypothetical protein
MALFIFYSAWRDMTSSSTSRDSMGTTRKTASGNNCETVSAIQRSYQMLFLFSPVIPVWLHKASSKTSRDSIGTTRKTASGNYCETVSAIQRSDQMLSPFSPVIPVWLHKASSSMSRDCIGTIRKMASGNYCELDPTVRSNVIALFTCYSGVASQGFLFND